MTKKTNTKTKIYVVYENLRIGRNVVFSFGPIIKIFDTEKKAKDFVKKNKKLEIEEWDVE